MDPARRDVVDKVDATAMLARRKKSPPGAEKREKKAQKVRMRMMSLVNKNSRMQQRPCALTRGASLHSSHRQLKQWARVFIAAEPIADARKPLKWSHTPIIFDAKDHPDCTTTVECFPLLVSPTIHNLKVMKVLVEGGAGLNLISPEVIERLQIPKEELKKMGTFQGINPRRS